jgi:hypothetical protein
LGRGSRIGKSNSFESGNMVLAHFEGGGYFKTSRIGNMAGIEGGADIGYDDLGYREKDSALGDMGMIIDIWMGFPVTLLNLGDGSNDWLRLSVAPGMGTSMVSGYLYVKSALAARLPGLGDAEVAWFWWPDAASYPFGANNNDAVNATSLRGSFFFGKKFHAFAEWRRSQREHVEAQKPDPKYFDGITAIPGQDGQAFTSSTRSEWEKNMRVGVGMTF